MRPLQAASVALLILGVADCGRTGLDTPSSVKGASGGAGACGIAGSCSFGGTSGAAGTSGGAGTSGVAGTSGSAGTGAIAGTGQAGATPDASAAGTAGASPAVCVEGSNECASATAVHICTDGAWGVPFSCAHGCIKGICAECIPGTASCVADTALQVCAPEGIFLPPTPCPSTCAGGACVGCVEGSTRCASHEGQQTCKGGQWTVAVDCPFVCVGTACGQNPRTVFVTSQMLVGGTLGGLAGADARCTEFAASANLPGAYQAWLSDATGSPVSRFLEDAGPYVLTNGTVIADNWTELTSGNLRHAIDRTETAGAAPPSTGGCGSHSVWSNTSSDGTLENPDLSCGDWSDPMARNAAWGNAASPMAWSDACSVCDADPTLACLSSAALYCFQQ